MVTLSISKHVRIVYSYPETGAFLKMHCKKGSRNFKSPNDTTASSGSLNLNVAQAGMIVLVASNTFLGRVLCGNLTIFGLRLGEHYIRTAF